MTAMSAVKTLTVTYVLTTYNGSTQIGTTSSASGTIYTTASISKPAFTNFTFSDNNNAVVNVTQNASLFVQSKSSLRVVCNTATAKNGASIVSYRATVGEKSIISSSTSIPFGTISDAGSLSLIVTAIDSRGYETSVTKDITVIDYESITIDSYHIRRENNVEDTIQFDFTGTLSPITVSGTVKNSFVSARYRTKNVSSTSWSSYATIGGVESGSSSFSFDNDSWITLSSANAYYVQLEVSDKLSTNTITLYINKGQPLVAFRTEKVGINTNDPQSALDVNGNITMNGQIVQGFVGEVGTGVSLNDVTASGIYYASWVNSTQSESNYPASNYGVLEVISPFSYFVMQRYTSNSGSVYVRVKLNNDWTAWKQVTT